MALEEFRRQGVQYLFPVTLQRLPVCHLGIGSLGGPGNIRPEWIQAIREAGYSSNASADNGQVDRASDPFLLPRVGASPQRSLVALRIVLDRAW